LQGHDLRYDALGFSGMSVRAFIFVLTMALSACASAPAQDAADSIEVVYVPDALFYTIEDGGRARVVGMEDRPFEFASSRADFRRVARILAPLQAEGVPCARPPQNYTPATIVFRRGGQELSRAPVYTTCDSGVGPLALNTQQAWNAMLEMGRARYVAPTIPEPSTIRVEWMSWGHPVQNWSVSRTGAGSFTHEGETQTFTVTPQDFETIRAALRPYESRHFECERTVYDLPYGAIVWSSREGQEDQRTRFDAGCTTGDADDLFKRLDDANAVVDRLRGAPPR
jgi:hypothetical protein